MATSYANPGGTGDRRAILDLSATDTTLMAGSTVFGELVNGSLADNLSYFRTQAVAGLALDWQFVDDQPHVIDAIRFTKDAGSFSSDACTMQFQGWDGASWNNIGAPFLLDGGGLTTYEVTFTNSTGYQGYRLLGVSGSSSSGPYFNEMEFRIGDPEGGGGDPEVSRPIININ